MTYAVKVNNAAVLRVTHHDALCKTGLENFFALANRIRKLRIGAGCIKFWGGI